MRSAATGVFLIACFLLSPAPGQAHGDKVVPQVVDGTGADGTRYRTKFDITNLGPDPQTRITKVSVLFFRQNGSPWSVATSQGTTSQINLSLGAFQTIRIETLGTAALTQGYAIVRNLEGTTSFAEDYTVNISVFYEVLRGTDVIDTVSVSVAQPTVAWVFPAETEDSRKLYTGFAVVNLGDGSNIVQLRLFRAGTPTSGDATDAGSVNFTLGLGEQRALFLIDATLFPNVTSFRGMALGTSDKPVAILALLQTPTPTGVQFSTLVPAYADALRRNTFMYLRQGFSLDVDIPVSDYFGNSQDTAPWDLLYETVSNTSRRLAPQPPPQQSSALSRAMVSVIGNLTDEQFDDDVTIESLRGRTYTTNPIDLNDGSPNLTPGFTFAVRTALGRYAKVRIRDVITRDTNRDLALEIYVYR